VLGSAVGVEVLFFGAAREALRRRPPKPPDFLFSPSVSSLSEVPPVRRSFLVPRPPKKEVRRLSVGVVLVAGAVVAAAVDSVDGTMGSVAFSVGAVVVPVVGEITGFSS